MVQYVANRGVNRTFSRIISDVRHRFSGGEEMNYWLTALVPIGWGLVFTLNLTGTTGAWILGLTVIIVDCAALRLRFSSIRKTGTSLKPAAVIGGLLFRILNLTVFLGLGSWWLVSAAQPLFHVIILTIPIWNLLAAATGWLKGNWE
jgi:hypothetical protein